MNLPARTSLKLFGHSSTARVEELVGSYLVDIAHISEVGREFLLVEPDDDDIDLTKENDFAWFERTVVETLRRAGEPEIAGSLHRSPVLGS